MKKLQLILENSDGHYWGWVENNTTFMPTGQGETIAQLIKNIKEAITDYLEHEGKEDLFWKKIKLDAVTFEIRYNLEAFFEAFDFINISSLSIKTGLSKTLLNQYKTGAKSATELQAKKIESAIHDLAQPMMKFKLVA